MGEQPLKPFVRQEKKTVVSRKPKSGFDVLTGLPGRNILYDRLSQSLLFAGRKGSVAALMFLCLNDLKLINDSYGQETGNEILKSSTERFRKCLRKTDSISRPGRDEFIILLPEITSQDDAIFVANKILRIFDKPFVIGGHELFINTSIGISVFPYDGITADVILKNAYTALQNARTEGKNIYRFFSSSMNSKAIARLDIENGLRLAIKRKEFILHFQPQIDLKKDKIVGMEALVRWQRPGSGLVPPSDFIQLAENTGLIVPIGEQVLRAACAQQRAWLDQGIAPERIAVNVSACQFRDQDMVETVTRALKKNRLDPKHLELELTESVVFENEGKTIETLIKLKDMGIHISIDDFGTGYSSLTYLRHFPINKLKLVHSFVRSISINSVDSAIAKLIIDLSQTLKIKVIAEGVETQEQIAFLRASGCDEVQGYLFSKPLTAEEATKVLRGNNPIRKRRESLI